MQMGYRIDVWTATVNGCVDVHFQGKLHALLQGLARQAGLDNILRAQAVTACTPGVDEEGVRSGNPAAHVSAEINEPEILQHADTRSRLNPQEILVHGLVPPFKRVLWVFT